MFAEIKKHRFEWFLYVAALAAGAVVLYQARDARLLGEPIPGMDQHSILAAARGIAAGTLPVPGSYLYSPAYTLFLALLLKLGGNSLVVVRLLQAAFCALLPVAVYRAARFSGAGRRAAQLAGLFQLFCGASLLISLEFLRAAPLALLFIWWYGLMLKTAWRGRGWALPAGCGAMAALCALGRENFLALAPLPPLFLLLFQSVRRRFLHPWRAVAVYCAAFLFTLAPVSIYHLRTTGSPAILPGNGTNVFEFMQGPGTVSTPGTSLLRVLKHAPRTVGAMLAPFEKPNSLSFYAFREFIPLLKVLAMPITLLFALAAVALAARFRNPAVAAGGILVAAYFGSLIFCDIYYRFRVPALPLLCVLAGGGAAWLIRTAKRRRWGRFAAGMLPVLAAVTVVWLDVPERRLGNSERAATAYLMIRLDRLERAGSLLDRYRTLGCDPLPAQELLLLRRLWTEQRFDEVEALVGKWNPGK